MVLSAFAMVSMNHLSNHIWDVQTRALTANGGRIGAAAARMCQHVEQVKARRAANHRAPWSYQGSYDRTSRGNKKESQWLFG